MSAEQLRQIAQMEQVLHIKPSSDDPIKRLEKIKEVQLRREEQVNTLLKELTPRVLKDDKHSIVTKDVKRSSSSPSTPVKPSPPVAALISKKPQEKKRKRDDIDAGYYKTRIAVYDCECYHCGHKVEYKGDKRPLENHYDNCPITIEDPETVPDDYKNLNRSEKMKAFKMIKKGWITLNKKKPVATTSKPEVIEIVDDYE